MEFNLEIETAKIKKPLIKYQMKNQISNENMIEILREVVDSIKKRIILDRIKE